MSNINTGRGTPTGLTRVAPPCVSVAIEVTGKCNLHCVHCYAESGKELPSTPFSRNEALLTDLAGNFDRVSLNFKGGEPLLAPGFRELLKRAVGLRFLTSVTTNGTLLTPRFVEEVKALGSVNFYISIDGPNVELNDALRGPGSYQRIVRGIHCLRAGAILFSLSTVVTASNVEHLTEMAQFARQHGADLLQLVRLRPDGRGRELADQFISEELFASAAARLASTVPPVTTLYDEAVVYGCDPRVKYRFFQEQFQDLALPSMFTVAWDNGVLLSHIRLKVGELTQSTGLSELITRAQQDVELRQQYASWLRAKLAATSQLRAKLGLE